MRFLRPILRDCDSPGCTSGSGNCGCNDPITLVRTVASTPGTAGSDGAIVLSSDSTQVSLSAISESKKDFTASTSAQKLTSDGDRYRISGVCTATNIPGTTSDYIRLEFGGVVIFNGELGTVPSGVTRDFYFEVYVNRINEKTGSNCLVTSKVFTGVRPTSYNLTTIQTWGAAYRAFNHNFAAATQLVSIILDKNQGTGTLTIENLTVERLLIV